MTTVFFDVKPGRVQYMKLPRGGADVWLRRNIREEDLGESGTQWAADEVYLRTELSRAEVEARFDELFDYVPPEPVSDSERLDALEAAMVELVEVLFNG